MLGPMRETFDELFCSTFDTRKTNQFLSNVQVGISHYHCAIWSTCIVYVCHYNIGSNCREELEKAFGCLPAVGESSYEKVERYIVHVH